MKITILDKKPDEEDEIIVKCEFLDEGITKLLNQLKNGNSKINFYKNNQIHLVEKNEVLYFESVDDKVFAYTQEDDFETKHPSIGALIVRDGKILFQRRTDNGKWGLIGGLLEMNETYEEAALREIREETGLEVRLDSFLGIFHNHNMVWHNGDAAHVISAFYTATIITGEPRIDEESYELQFFGKNEMPELFAEDHIAALQAYFSGVRYPLLQENRKTDY